MGRMGSLFFTGLASCLPDVELGLVARLGLTAWFGFTMGVTAVAVFSLVTRLGARWGVDVGFFSDGGG